MKVTSKEQAWIEASKIFPTDYEKDYASSARAGYDIYRHNSLNYYNRICDLGDRLEVLTGEYGENVTNIWIIEEKRQPMKKARIYNLAMAALMEKIERESTRQADAVKDGRKSPITDSNLRRLWCEYYELNQMILDAEANDE